ncbi:NAD(P)-binding protein [Aspergillus unguis]
MPSTTRAVFTDQDGTPYIGSVDEVYEPLSNEVLVDVQFSGINPADVNHARIGFNNTVAGYDFSGVVIKVGGQRENQFKPGDRVLGFAAPALNKQIQYGTHQDLHCARHFIYHVPSSMPMEDAACLMVVTHTAADALFNQLQVSFENETQPILIWGGSSAVGTAAIQFAKKAGCYPIITTASPRNHGKLQEIGATVCLDYNDANIIQNIRSALSARTTKPLKRVLDAVVSRAHPSSTEICEACIDDPSVALFTSPVPASADAKNHWSRTFACRNVEVDFKLPNGTILQHTPNRPMQDKIDRATCWAISAYGHGYCMPRVVIVQSGEEGIRTMLDVSAGKASMQKFVIQHPI